MRLPRAYAELRDRAHRALGLGRPWGLGLRAVLRYRRHLAELEEEAPLAAVALRVLVESGVHPLRAFRAHRTLDSLPAAALEAARVERDAALAMRDLGEQLFVESGRGGIWSRLLGTLATLERTGADPRLALRDLTRLAAVELRARYASLAEQFRSLVSTGSILFGVMPIVLPASSWPLTSVTVKRGC